MPEWGGDTPTVKVWGAERPGVMVGEPLPHDAKRATPVREPPASDAATQSPGSPEPQPTMGSTTSFFSPRFRKYSSTGSASPASTMRWYSLGTWAQKGSASWGSPVTA